MVGLTLADALQAVGWMLALLGQVQVARKRRTGFAIWVVANVVLMAAFAGLEMWWSAGTLVASTAVCSWAYRAWGKEEGGSMRSLFVNKSVAW